MPPRTIGASRRGPSSHPPRTGSVSSTTIRFHNSPNGFSSTAAGMGPCRTGRRTRPLLADALLAELRAEDARTKDEAASRATQATSKSSPRGGALGRRFRRKTAGHSSELMALGCRVAHVHDLPHRRRGDFFSSEPQRPVLGRRRYARRCGVGRAPRAGGLPRDGLGQRTRPNARAGIPPWCGSPGRFRTSSERRKRHPNRRPSLRRLSAGTPAQRRIDSTRGARRGGWQGSALPTPTSCSTAVGQLARGAAVRRPCFANGDSTAFTVSTAGLHGGWPRAASS